MTENNQQEAQQEAPKTPQEVAALHRKMIEYYNKQIPVLKVQSQYEELAADIEESRLRRATATMRLAHLMAGPEKEKVKSEVPSPETSKTPEPKTPESVVSDN